MKDAEHVEIHGSLEIGARQLMKRHVDRRQPRIVECAIKATEFGDGDFHGRPRVVLDTDVAMAVDGVATFRAYQSDRFLGCGFDDIGVNHIRAPTRKTKGGIAAVTAACARHDLVSTEEHTPELQSLMRFSY